MGRETDDEREARLKEGGAWLEAELKKRDWSQKHLAALLGVAPQQVSAYIRGRYEIDGKLVRENLAPALGLPQREVFRGMRLWLPEECESEEALADYYQAKYPGVFKRVAELTGEDTEPRADTPGPGDGHARVTRKPVARKSGEEPRRPRKRASGG